MVQNEQDSVQQSVELQVTEKMCSKCKTVKKLSEFHKHKDYKYGVHRACKVCRSDGRAKTDMASIARSVPDGFVFCKSCNKLKEHNLDNFHHSKLRAASKVLICIKCRRDKNKLRSQDPNFKAQQKIRSSAWARDNKAHKNNKAREWKRNNKEKVMAGNNAYMSTEKAKALRSKAAAARYKLNPEKYKAKSSAYCSRVRKAKPKWENENKILKYYKMAKKLGLEVDHIVPINSKLVCGLHCLDNFQFLNRKDNASKGNRYWPNMPE